MNSENETVYSGDTYVQYSESKWGYYKNWTQDPGPEDRGPKDPRTQGPNDLALLHLETQLVSMF